MATLQIAGEKLEDQNTVGSHDTTISSAIDSHYLEIWTGTNEDAPIVRHKPVEYEGDKPILNPSAMVVGYPYQVILYGQFTFAIKAEDGTIDFFGLPK